MKKFTGFLLVLTALLTICILLTGCNYDLDLLGISSIQFNDDGDLTLTMNDGTVTVFEDITNVNNDAEIIKTEVIDGYLWITYAYAPDLPVKCGKITHEGTEGLKFTLLYAVGQVV